MIVYTTYADEWIGIAYTAIRAKTGLAVKKMCIRDRLCTIGLKSMPMVWW